jgi:hypothetical protein
MFLKAIFATVALIFTTSVILPNKLAAETITLIILSDRTVQEVLFPGDGKTQMMSLEEFRTCNPAFANAEVDTIVQAATEIIQPIGDDTCPNLSGFSNGISAFGVLDRVTPACVGDTLPDGCYEVEVNSDASLQDALDGIRPLDVFEKSNGFNPGQLTGDEVVREGSFTFRF